jgi:hypothetical protein
LALFGRTALSLLIVTGEGPVITVNVTVLEATWEVVPFSVLVTTQSYEPALLVLELGE